VRDVVRRELVARQLDEQLAGRFPLGQRLRVLDVGMGRGTQALRLARAGHMVTGLEDDPAMISAAHEALAAEPQGIRERMRIVEGDGRDTGVHFLPGSFDVVLCHDVLMWVAEPDPLLAGLARMLAPGGLLSLLVRNGDALAFGPGLRGDWTGALAAFDATARLPRPRTGSDGETETEPALRPGPQERADRLADLTATLAGIGAPLHAWYGVRVFTDTVFPEPPRADGGSPHAGFAPAGFPGAAGTTLPVGAHVAGPHTGIGGISGISGVGGIADVGGGVDMGTLLAVEERAGRTDPYRAVAALLHLCGVRG
jgi:S-adenosylmethionine-dependent methyltransferase